jgi:3-hydroxymyristoyl/3-hydroxydecanoyl-(acyl carrier protein) dehydratase
VSETIVPAHLLASLDAHGADAILRDATRTRLGRPGTNGPTPALDRQAIERLLPHRDPFLLVDQVDFVDRPNGLITASYDLQRASHVLAGHFPGRPVWPGVLQVEAIAQTGCLLCAIQRDEALDEVAATHILGARFVRPIVPGAPVEIVATGAEAGLFYTVIGQCLQHGSVCAAAVISAFTPSS